MTQLKIVPVILCGGKGERLWPLSRESFPKQFISLGIDGNKSLLQKTYERIQSLENLDKPIFICNEEHRFIVAEQLRKINIEAKSILLEPIGRNTAPAITVACLKAIENDNNHYLRDEYLHRNQNDRILQSIRNLHQNNNKQFADLIAYKKKYNLDDKLHSDITSKVLSSSNDNYEYKNQPNILTFIMDLFKPSN